tara:strand:- start:144 stop:1088 length:945 start_codon:yes stop_codon:yes gene_type:complete
VKKSKTKFKRVTVVLGGNSGERAVSLDSGKACIKALKKKKYQVSLFDPKYNNFNLLDKSKTDVIFNALHGKDGEDGVAQSYFEYLRIPYTHSGIISSYNAMNKVISKEIFTKNKILTPKYFSLKKNEISKKKLKEQIERKNIKFPIVVKPTNEGSSLGVKICKDFSNLYSSSKALNKKYNKIIFEEFIGGQEVQVAVLDDSAIGAIELIPKRSFYDYKAKYTKSAKTEHVMPANLKKQEYNKVLKIAQKAHIALKCKGVTRSDFKYFKSKFYLLELNTQPGMTNLSLVPEIAKHCGINFSSLVERILLDASINR